MNYKISNGKLLIYDNEDFSIIEDDLYIKDGVIVSVGDDNISKNDNYEVIDAKDKLIMPGLINMHTHVYMTVLRNFADDVDFGEWLFGKIDPAESKLTKEDAYYANLLGFAEMFRSGTTSYVDMHMFRCQSAKAANSAGIRAFIGRGLVGDDLFGDGMERYKEALDEIEKYTNDTTSFLLAPHAIYTCSPKFYTQVAKEAERLGILKETHLSESKTEVSNSLEKYKKTPVEVLKDTGFLDEKTILAHCVQMMDGDIDIIKKAGSHVVTNPASNAKLGNGFAPMDAFAKAGVNICIGTDGTASNNTLNMFREMGLLSLIHKGIACDSTAMPAKQVIAAATVNAAKALGMEGKLGIIKKDALADLVFIDLKAPSMYPNNNIISSLCYSANGSEVEDVMINGKFVMRNKELLTIDLEEIYKYGKSWERLR